MSDLRKAAERYTRPGAIVNVDVETTAILVDLLRQALAQPEQEPVAGMFEEKLPDQDPPPWVRDYKPKREWVEITYDEVYEFVCTTDSYINFARAIEAKLKEKNT